MKGGDYKWGISEKVPKKQSPPFIKEGLGVVRVIKNYSLFTIHYPLFAIHYSLSTIHYSLFTIHYKSYTNHP